MQHSLQAAFQWKPTIISELQKITQIDQSALSSTTLSELQKCKTNAAHSVSAAEIKQNRAEMLIMHISQKITA